MSLKASIVMAYNNRPQQLENTLRSYEYWYSDIMDDFELIVIDDSSHVTMRADRVLDGYKGKYTCESVDRSHKPHRNPGVLYNRAVELSSSDLIFLTNPENIHCGPVLKAGIKEHKLGSYTIFGCRTMRPIAASWINFIKMPDRLTNWDEVNGWYQHSQIYNRLLHFAAFIDKSTYNQIGGFDPIYDDGVGFEDNDFIEKIIQAEIPITVIDEPFVGHQAHGRPEPSAPYFKNQKVFIDKWGYMPRDFTPKVVNE